MLDQISATKELLDIFEYGSADYNSAKAELEVAQRELHHREIETAETKEKLVLKYLELCLEFTDLKTTQERQTEIKNNLNSIREQLHMNKI